MKLDELLLISYVFMQDQFKHYKFKIQNLDLQIISVYGVRIMHI